MIRKCDKLSDEPLEEIGVFEKAIPYAPAFSILTKDFHAIIIRDEDGTVHGGATVEINKSEQQTPYAEICQFFISDTLRGTGLGTIIMKKIEDYVQDMGIYEIRLDTAEYQAPGFYKKMGYEQTGEHVNMNLRTLEYFNGYNFVKKLAFPETAEPFQHDAGAEVIFMGHSEAQHDSLT